MVQVRYYSGYIRNFKKVCEELGITPLSREQREEQILIKGFEKWGTELPEHIFGAFAFALYDDAADKLYVFRDPVGQKQLFYAVAGDELLCSGDIDAIVTDSRIEKRLNMRMLQQYLFYGYPIGEETFYEGVYKLKGGHWLEWDGNMKVGKFMQYPTREEIPETINEQAIVELYSK